MKIEVKKIKGFRGHKFIATEYVDSNGDKLPEDIEDGTDIVVILSQTHIYNSDGTVTKEIETALKNAIDKEIIKIKPLYKPC